MYSEKVYTAIRRTALVLHENEKAKQKEVEHRTKCLGAVMKLPGQIEACNSLEEKH